MRYQVRAGVLVPFVQKYYKLLILAIAGLFTLSYMVMTLTASAAPKNKPISGPGNVQVGIDVSTWESNNPSGPGLIPIGGNGQVNGEFTVAERNGIQIGLRAQDRFTGTIEAIPNENAKVGMYYASTGYSDNQQRATWNYDWHVDLRNARGVYKGTTLGDYSLMLETDIAENSLFGLQIPLDLYFGGLVPNEAVLYQSSQNPKFGNSTFEANDEGVYNFRLVLTPKTFNGPSLAVAIQVNVVDQ